MSLTDTARHWLWGCALATAASKSDVNVAMPHLRGKWSLTKAILRTLDALFMKAFLCCLAAWRLFDQSYSPVRATDGKWSGSLRFCSSRRRHRPFCEHVMEDRHTQIGSAS